MKIELEEQYDRIYRYCYYKLRHQQKAEDITQETFLRYLERGGIGDDGRPLAFLYTIARNLCTDEFRRRKIEKLPEDLPGTDFQEKLEDTIVVRQALMELSEQERELILLRYVNEVPVADLAKLYGISRFSLYRETKKVLKKLERGIADEERTNGTVKKVI